MSNQGEPSEYKAFPSVVTNTDEAQGIVDAVFAVFGNIDEGNDRVHLGSFSKTFAERGNKVRVLDHHNARSILNVIGKPLDLRELRREELPQQLLEKYPQATGGASAKVQFLMDVPEGRGAFIRLRDKAVDEWSFGYDVLDSDFSKEYINDKEITVRNLRTIKLFEISPVIWGMNPATTTLGAKGTEEKAVMKTEADGEHPASHYLVVEDPKLVTTWHLRVRDVNGNLDHNLMGDAWAALHGGYRGNPYEGPNKQEAIRKLNALNALYESEGMELPKEADINLQIKQEALEIAQTALQQINELLSNLHAPDESGRESDAPGQGAGPEIPPTPEDTERLRLELLSQLETFEEENNGIHQN